MIFKPQANLYFIIITLLIGCSSTKPYYSKEFEDWRKYELPDESKLEHVVYLLGDAGEKEPSPAVALANKMLMQEKDSASTVIWLGDNIYYAGLPDVTESDRKEKEEVLLRLLRAADSTFTGRVIFIPGNHDWNESLAGGLEAVNRQEAFVEEYYGGKDAFLPSNGCAGPVEVNINDDFVIIVVDSEWWSHKYAKSRYPDNGCTVEDKIDLVIQLEDAIRSNQNKHIMVVAHHPIMSNSSHGGHFTFLDHIFPLRLVRDHLYIPLPLIGSLYPILRKLGVTPQDIPSPEGQQWKDAVLSMTQHRPNVIYAAGHDHNLQLHRYGSMHHILSGSASKTTFAARKFDASFVHQKKGFARVLYYNDGQVWVEYYYVDGDNPEGNVSLRTPLYSFKPPEPKKIDYEGVPDYGDSVKTLAANKNYKLSKFSEFFMGSHYRKEWITPVTIPYLDVKTFSGGLEPVKKGGRRQTLSLRLINDDSVQFVLRSVEKFPDKAIPDQFRRTWITDFVTDQISTAHPYGALTIPIMADAIDIFYTRPKLVYTPYTPYLQQYVNQFGGMMGMIEVRPDEDLSEFSRFGNSENIVSSETMFRHLRRDNDNEVDQKLFLKSRLFDMIIGDWDRHEDQWRWAEYKKDKGSLFKPIPRDRDQAYAKYDGIIPWLLSRKWTFRNFVSFEEEIEDVISLNMVSQNLDRILLSELTREDWHRTALEIQIQLSDYVIESAIKDMPPEVYNYSGEEIIRKLKARRDNIMKAAMEYYDFLSREAYIVTSDKHERYEITRKNSDTTIVKIFKINMEGEVDNKIYERIFLTDETEELRIFSRGGSDRFIIQGEVKDGIELKIVGGEDRDEFNVSSKIRSRNHSIHIYDNDTGNIFNINNQTKLTLDKEEWVNSFSRNLYQLNFFGPQFTTEYNIDDGWLIGVGFKYNIHGFKTEPYKARHFLMAHRAFNTGAYRFYYEGQFYNLLRHTWDLRVKGDYYGPDYVFNYFGFGNQTVFDKSKGIEYYRIKMDAFLFEPAILHRFSPVLNIGLGPVYEYFNIHEDPESILGELSADPLIKTEENSFAGGKFFSEIKLVEKVRNPQKGMRWYNEVKYLREINNQDFSFTSLESELSFYFTPNLPVDATFALRLGGGTNIGDFYFFQSRYLGGVMNLRGYRRSRFAGKSNFYSNNEVRIKAIRFSNSLLTGDIGLIGFYDLGKVWTGSADASEWHNSVGPGAYLNIYGTLILSGTYAISEEDDLFNFRVGFLF